LPNLFDYAKWRIVLGTMYWYSLVTVGGYLHLRIVLAFATLVSPRVALCSLRRIIFRRI
jgi:hypothetical protein